MEEGREGCLDEEHCVDAAIQFRIIGHLKGGREGRREERKEGVAKR